MCNKFDKSKVKISIVIPCFNCAKFIEKCIDSILGQTHDNIEIILLNDGSTDNTNEVITKYVKSNKNIIYINNENHGVSYTRNMGIQYATGDYLMFIDSDDFIGENYIKSFVDKTINTPDLIIGGFSYLYQNGTLLNVDGIEFDAIPLNQYLDKFYIDSIANRILFGPINKLYKLDVLKNNSIRFNENISIREDGMFVLDYLAKCSSVAGVQNNEYYYYQQTKGTSLVTRFNSYELDINEVFFKQILSLTRNNKKNRIVELIYPMYLDMDYSSIIKYYFSDKYTLNSGLNYIKLVKQREVYKEARKELLKVDFKKALKYYRPLLLIHIQGYLKRVKEGK